MRRTEQNRHTRGLTLIEVMVALGVLVILVSGIFFVVQTSLKTVLTIDNSASRLDEITNLTDILRSNFRNLPARARLTADTHSEGNVSEFLFIVRDAPGFLTWSAKPEAENTIVILSLRGNGSDWRVCMKRFAPPSHFPEQEFAAKPILRAASKIPWLELVGGFQQARARFFDGKSRTWKDRWDNLSERPALIELTLVSEIVRDPRSETAIFWIPPVMKGGSA